MATEIKKATSEKEPKKEDNGDRYAEYDIEIHGRPYRGVDGRIKEWRDQLNEKGLADQVIQKEAFWDSDGVLVCQIRIYCPINGYGEATAGAYGKSPIDKSNPYENAETSAVGRLLGFWGYGLLGGGIASAEEVTDARTQQTKTTQNDPNDATERTPGGASIKSYYFLGKKFVDQGIAIGGKKGESEDEHNARRDNNYLKIREWLETRGYTYNKLIDDPLYCLDQRTVSEIIDVLGGKKQSPKLPEAVSTTADDLIEQVREAFPEGPPDNAPW